MIFKLNQIFIFIHNRLFLSINLTTINLNIISKSINTINNCFKGVN